MLLGSLRRKQSEALMSEALTSRRPCAAVDAGGRANVPMVLGGGEPSPQL